MKISENSLFSLIFHDNAWSSWQVLWQLIPQYMLCDVPQCCACHFHVRNAYRNIKNNPRDDEINQIRPQAKRVKMSTSLQYKS